MLCQAALEGLCKGCRPSVQLGNPFSHHQRLCLTEIAIPHRLLRLTIHVSHRKSLGFSENKCTIACLNLPWSWDVRGSCWGSVVIVMPFVSDTSSRSSSRKQGSARLTPASSGDPASTIIPACFGQ